MKQQDASKVSTWNVFWLGTLGTIQAVLTVAFALSAPRFQNMYGGFSAPVPAVTKVLFDHLLVAFVFLVVCGLILLGLFVRLVASREFSARNHYRAFGLISIAVALLFMVLLYLPAIRMGSPV